jgi:DNA mismatch repair protein MutL
LGKIKLLSDQIINQIAAGEIVERPCSALKEIVENSIDANAKNINIFLKHGGKSKIVVEDDGDGLLYDDLTMCLQRHATSKLSGLNLFDVKSYGFRGEALPSIASVSNFTIESSGFGISVNFSEISDIFPSKISHGTVVTIENLFNQVPARLKFLKSDNAELSACISIIENFAIINNRVNFSLRSESRNIISYQNESIENRIANIFGAEIFERSVYFDGSDGAISMSGYLFHPSDSKFSQDFQRFFVNSRFIKDKTISAAIRNAYRDLVPIGRFAIAIIFIEVDPFYVDVNVSPTKSEIRFRDSKYMQKIITDIVKKNLNKFDRIITPINANVITHKNLSDDEVTSAPYFDQRVTDYLIDSDNFKTQFRDNNNSIFSKISLKENIEIETIKSEFQPKTFENLKDEKFFGIPICQIFDSYIISEKEDSIIIIDQHAVHEKITQMKILKELEIGQKQYLVTPETIKISDKQKEQFTENEQNLLDCGFEIELSFDQKSLTILAIPSVIDEKTATDFISNILDFGEELTLPAAIRQKIANIACHNSIRFGRKLSIIEIDALLRQMEMTESIHQCNHHRPSFIQITKEQLEKMFHRT